jgi:hypothetical protein
MKTTLLFFAFIILSTAKSYSNDGGVIFYGNQLIPIHENEIEIKKEVLEIKRITNDTFEVFVDYTFFNPGEEKTILVAFEAPPPYGQFSSAFNEIESHEYIYMIFW